ncbi:sentrin/sumo-specific protease, putative [Coccidioides posadasii C735 delta SOWgp]|uniref:Sentrin/sumo-specific protease, putative n=1 Tax=Coccidioides posadasii (strain C735) TaxID=222929 RepID=C5PEN6_COCP7|nr:sentrin/sumo-specific protease, putative [Coccidioides posadasii C735 delta SOWgp]EER24556.1 sentrin/sumo-specific protease, putative [Coccidioides posadasii C735 delta SOWgp]|eukprot:XP_003066701.1 sentrin/sumo-specific protease, putative [Coccidioides posadasii C735 delta SOWgp]
MDSQSKDQGQNNEQQIPRTPPRRIVSGLQGLNLVYAPQPATSSANMEQQPPQASHERILPGLGSLSLDSPSQQKASESPKKTKREPYHVPGFIVEDYSDGEQETRKKAATTKEPTDPLAFFTESLGRQREGESNKPIGHDSDDELDRILFGGTPPKPKESRQNVPRQSTPPSGYDFDIDLLAEQAAPDGVEVRRDAQESRQATCPGGYETPVDSNPSGQAQGEVFGDVEMSEDDQQPRQSTPSSGHVDPACFDTSVYTQLAPPDDVQMSEGESQDCRQQVPQNPAPAGFSAAQGFNGVFQNLSQSDHSYPPSLNGAFLAQQATSVEITMGESESQHPRQVLQSPYPPVVSQPPNFTTVPLFQPAPNIGVQFNACTQTTGALDTNQGQAVGLQTLPLSLANPPLPPVSPFDNGNPYCPGFDISRPFVSAYAKPAPPKPESQPLAIPISKPKPKFVPARPSWQNHSVYGYLGGGFSAAFPKEASTDASRNVVSASQPLVPTPDSDPQSDESKRQQGCDGDTVVSGKTQKLSPVKRKIDEVEDPMQNEIDTGRASRSPLVELKLANTVSLGTVAKCACQLSGSEGSKADAGDFVMQPIPGSWPRTPTRPSPINHDLSKEASGNESGVCAKCKHGNAMSSSSFVPSPIPAQNQPTWVVYAKRILGTVKRQVSEFCKACPPARKFMTWCEYRKRQREEQRNQRQSQVPVVHVTPASLPTVTPPGVVTPPTHVSSRRSTEPRPTSKAVRKDKVPSQRAKSKDSVQGISSGRVTKSEASWRGRSIQSTSEPGPRRQPNNRTPFRGFGRSRAAREQVRQELETKMAAWFTSSPRPNLPSLQEEMLPVQPETPARTPLTIVEAQGVASAEPTAISQPASPVAEPVRPSEEPRTKQKSVHWLPSTTPRGRPISSVRVFDPQASVFSVAAKREDSKRPAGRPTPRIRQGPIIRPLPAKWESKVDTALSQPDSRQLGTTLSGDALTRRDFATCATPLAWLNDEIINAYLALIIDYARRSSGNLGRHHQPKHHAFNTFFYSSLRDKGYESVRRWASRAKIGGPALLRVESVFVPIHNHAHWTLMVVKPAVRTIEHFDSLGGSSSAYVAKIKEWLRGELGNLFVEEEWRVLPSTSPQQNNGSDCGVFLLTTAKLVALEQPLSYGPRDIPAIRKRIVAELMNGGLDGDFDPKREFDVRSLL